MLHCNGVLHAGAGTVRVGGLPVEKRHLAEIRRRVGIVFQDPDDQLFMPTVRDDVAFGPTNFGVRGAELDARVERRARRRRHGRDSPTARRTTSASGSVDASRWPPCSRAIPSCWCSTNRRRTSIPASRRELADIVRRLDVTLLMVTHDLIYALELCPRAVVIDEGVIVADGPTSEILMDRDAHGGTPLGAPRWTRSRRGGASARRHGRAPRC